MKTSTVNSKKVKLTITGEVTCSNLPQIVIDKIKEDLTFQNQTYQNAANYGGYIPQNISEFINFYEQSEETFWVPRGYIFFLKKFLKENDIPHKIIDKTLKFKKLDIHFHGQLRDYQEEAVFNAVSRYPVGVIEAATGAGKTVTAIGIIAQRKQPTLILVHTKELLYQWKGAIKKFLDYDCGLLGDGKNKLKPITVGIINTVRNRIEQLHDKFGQIVIDECFPAGTLVDGKPIETIKIGDYVNSFNHKTGKIEKKKVTYLFKKKPETLCTVKLVNGQEITCTENHPFFTDKGYLTASELNDTTMLNIDVNYISERMKNENSYMSEMWNNKQSERTVQKETVKTSLSRLQTKANCAFCSMCSMWKNSKMSREQTGKIIIGSSKKQQCKMFGKMFKNPGKTRTIESRRMAFKIQQKTRKCKNETKQPNAQQRKYRKNENNKTCKWNSECLERNTRRKWSTDSSAGKVSNCIGMGNRSFNSNSRSYSTWKKTNMVQKKESANMLQSGCGQQKIKNCNRSRWQRNSCRKTWKTGQEERIPFKMERVESVTIHQRTSGQGFESLCKDGYVYNIEVEDNHNYFVDGVLVHNCHRCPSNTWSDTIQNFPAKYYLGLSATLYRRDGLGKAILYSIGPRVHSVDKQMLQDTGAVLKPEIRLVNTQFRASRSFADEEQMNYSSVIKKLTEDRERNKLISYTIYRDLKEFNENIIVVSDRVQHLTEIANILDKLRIKNRVLSGRTGAKQRKKIVSEIKNKKCSVLLATISLIGEGFDAPDLSAMFLTTPVKFEGRLIQTVGRILRPKDDKVPRLYDFRDDNVRVLQNSGYSRNRTYKKEGW